ncbi:MAG TPA: hypothetical protein VGL07_14275 [Buttiauxella sp.]
MLNIESTPGDGDVDMRVLIELAAISVQGAEDTDLNTLFACPAEHGAGGAAEQIVEQGPVVVEKWPEQVGHGESDMLPVTVEEDVLLLSNPLFGGSARNANNEAKG